MFAASRQIMEPEPLMLLRLAADTENRLEGDVAVRGVLPAPVMRGQDGVRGAPGRLSETILLEGNYEFPSIDGRTGGAAHGRVYLTFGSEPGILHSRMAALDTRTERLDAFDFGSHVNAGEPVFAADPAGGPDQGWIITQTLDMRHGETKFAVLDASRLADGPVATISIGEAVPVSFYGQWVSKENV